MIECANVSHTVMSNDTSLTLLHQINLTIHEGQSIAVVGPSGSGKTTLLSMLAGLDIPTAGKVFIDKTDIVTLNEEKRAKIRAKYVSFVFQNFQLVNHLSAIENVSLALEVKGIDNAKALAEDYLERVKLAHRLNHYPQQLSGGEQQRVAIARAFACQTPLLFADEPTGNLDHRSGQHISDLIFDLHKEKRKTLILVTHDQSLAKRCERRFIIEAGHLHED